MISCLLIVVFISWPLLANADIITDFASKLLSTVPNVEPNSIVEYVMRQGYRIETHEVETEDGYLLTVHRIPHGKGASGNSKCIPVLHIHGLLSASSNWLLEAHSYAFTLAEAGFDVWLGNTRGNTYSRKHVKYDPDKDEEAFFNFSWHEVGVYDLPASIDYVLNYTGNQDLFYTGHSMGTTVFAVLGAMRPEYMKKIRAAGLMAPIVYLANVRSPIFDDLYKVIRVIESLRAAGVNELFTVSTFTLWANELICAHELLQAICTRLVFGSWVNDLNRTSLTTVLNYAPNGGSVKSLLHYLQIGNTDMKFRQYDYGLIQNPIRYKSVRPPSYNLSNVNAPTHIYYAKSDNLAVPEDVQDTINNLPNVQSKSMIEDERFTHVDFIWAKDAKPLVYDDIILKFKSYN